MTHLLEFLSLSCREDVQRLLWLWFSFSNIIGLTISLNLYILHIREKKLLNYSIIVFCFFVAFYLHEVLLCISPGPYPEINANKQNLHMMRIFLGCVLLASTMVAVWLHFILKQGWLKSFLVIFSNFFISFFINSLIW